MREGEIREIERKGERGEKGKRKKGRKKLRRKKREGRRSWPAAWPATNQERGGAAVGRLWWPGREIERRR